MNKIAILYPNATSVSCTTPNYTMLIFPKGEEINSYVSLVDATDTESSFNAVPFLFKTIPNICRVTPYLGHTQGGSMVTIEAKLGWW